MPDTDANGTPWVTNRLQASLDKHAKQHRGEDKYLAEVKDVYNAIKAQQFDVDVPNSGHDSNKANITYLGFEESQGKHKYLVKVGSTPRTMVITDQWEVLHYARQADAIDMQNSRVFNMS